MTPHIDPHLTRTWANNETTPDQWATLATQLASALSDPDREPEDTDALSDAFDRCGHEAIYQALAAQPGLAGLAGACELAGWYLDQADALPEFINAAHALRHRGHWPDLTGIEAPHSDTQAALTSLGTAGRRHLHNGNLARAAELTALAWTLIVAIADEMGEEQQTVDALRDYQDLAAAVLPEAIGYQAL